MKNLFNNDNNPCFGKNLPRPLTLWSTNVLLFKGK